MKFPKWISGIFAATLVLVSYVQIEVADPIDSKLLILAGGGGAGGSLGGTSFRSSTITGSLAAGTCSTPRQVQSANIPSFSTGSLGVDRNGAIIASEDLRQQSLIAANQCCTNIGNLASLGSTPAPGLRDGITSCNVTETVSSQLQSYQACVRLNLCIANLARCQLVVLRNGGDATGVNACASVNAIPTIR